MKLEVRILGDPVLRQKAAPVAEVSEATKQLIRDMFETMYAEEGVGLAAPQVGISERIIVVDPQQDDLPAFALINPEIVELSKETEKGEEVQLKIVITVSKDAWETVREGSKFFINLAGAIGGTCIEISST